MAETAEQPTEVERSDYAETRPASYFKQFHDRVRRHQPNWVHPTARIIMIVAGIPAFRLLPPRGRQHIPRSGAVIIAPNHFSFFDHFIVAVYIRRAVRFMAKSQLFKGILGGLLAGGGTFPVRRGVEGGDEEAMETGRLLLGNGEALIMYCEGERSRSGKLKQRARPGIGRLALETGAPVVPTAIHGSQKRGGWRKLLISRVTVEFSEPIRFTQVADPSKEECIAASETILVCIRVVYRRVEARRTGGSGRRKPVVAR